jgi:hypothetical protein
MVRQYALIVLGLIAGVIPLHAQQSGIALPSVEQIAARYLEARGGLEKIRAVRSLILRGPPRPGGRPGRFMARARPSYFLVGEPGTAPGFAEGYDGASWEFYRDPGLVLRTSHAPSAASRHTAYFDDPLVNASEPGWRVELLGTERIGDRPSYWLRATYPDSFQVDLFVDRETWLIIANRKTAQIHAFGDAIKTETRVSGYQSVNGALFPTKFEEYVIATGQPVEALSPGWVSIQANVPLPLDYFSPPREPDTPLARMLNAVFASRNHPGDALGWYLDFRRNPTNNGIDTEAGMEAVGYQCLKNGAVETAILLLEANLKDYPRSAAAHFGLGRAYNTADRTREAEAHFRQALSIDPAYQRAADALAEMTRQR